MQSHVQLQVTTVLSRMLALSNSSARDARVFSSALDGVLDDIRSNDGFGTEAQRDPRGDGRDGRWSMDCVEGIDNRDDALEDGEVQRRVELVLERIKAMAQADVDVAAMLRDAMNSMLDELKQEGCFDNGGDPRGTSEPAQWSVASVTDHLTALARSSVEDAHRLADALEGMLDDIRGNDGFGTEAQSDPRGDGRNGSWCMTYVEGIDDREGADAPDGLVQQRVARVLERMTAMATADEDDAKMFADFLDEMFDELQQVDALGLDGENDPRGDFSRGIWSMKYVEGVDA